MYAQQQTSHINLKTIDSLFALKVSHQHNVANRSLLQSSAISSSFKKSNTLLKQALTNTVEKQDICYDTSGRFFLYNDTLTYYVEAVLSLKDGSIFISGEYANKITSTDDGGFAIKCDEYGNVKWWKLYTPVNTFKYDYINYSQATELQDGSVLMGGHTYDSVVDNNDVILTRITSTGSIIWSKVYKSRLWQNGGGSADYFVIEQLFQDTSNGDVYFTGEHWSNGRNITRISIIDGKIIWSNFYGTQDAYFSFDAPFGIDIQGNEIISFGRFLYYGDPYLGIYRIDKLGGDTIETKFFNIDDTAGYKLGFLSNGNFTKLNNGNYALSGSMYGYYQYLWDGVTPLYQAGVAEFDKNINFVKAYIFKAAVETNLYNTLVSVYPDGSSLFTMLNIKSSYTADVYFSQVQNQQIVKQRRRYYTEGLPIETNSLRMADGGDIKIKLVGDSATNINKIEFLKLHISDTASDCLGYNDNSTSLQPYKLKPGHFYLDDLGKNDFSEHANKQIKVKDIGRTFLPGCSKIAHCDTLALKVAKDSICLGQSLALTVVKNPACGALPYFSYDTSYIKTFSQVNDSDYLVRFKKPWQGFIAATINNCIILKDSVKITVLQAPDTLNIGSDTAICKGSNYKLNAHAGYASYVWQDGSKDSVFLATQAGKYYVTVTDACGGIYADTVNVKIVDYGFNAGNDTIKCNNDTIQLSASKNFSNYQWQPLYNVAYNNNNIIIVHPSADTNYVVSAEKGGCVFFDTIHVKVFTSPSIFLGNDTTLCTGALVLLNAGNGFSNYAWNTGDHTQTISASQAGEYTVSANDANGCISTDTFNILSVQPPPHFVLGNDTTLCQHETLQLNPKVSGNYLWQDGSTANNYSIENAGLYWLQVTQNGCASADSINVNYKSVPVVNLGYDTGFCSGKSLLLNAYNSNINSYLWQDNSTQSNYLVMTSGKYYVHVTYNNGCMNNDTINVAVSQPPSFSLGADTILCDTKTISYNFNISSAGYVWSDGNTTNQNTIHTAGKYWLAVSLAGCSSSDTINVQYKPSPKVNLGNDTSLCTGVVYTLSAYYPNATYLWQDNSLQSTYNVTKQGSYFVLLNLNGCIDSDTINIAYISAPIFSLGNDTALCPGQTITLEPTIKDALYYKWQDGSTSNHYTVTTAGLYSLQTANNCGSSTDAINVSTATCLLEMPTAFTPNRDGRNDVFKVPYPEFIKHFHMVIYNRWGAKIFETNDAHQGWDGNVNSLPQNQGSYVWIITLTDYNNKVQTANGLVTLIR